MIPNSPPYLPRCQNHFRQPSRQSPVKRSHTSSDDDIPSSQPAPKRPRADMSFNTLRNKIASPQTTQAKAKKSSCVLKEHIVKSTCPVSLQYRPRPHLRTDRSFDDAVKQISMKAEQDLLALMVRQQEQNIRSDTEAINSLNAQLTTLFPDQPQLDLAHKRVQSASQRSMQRTARTSKSAQQPPATPADYATLQAKFKEIQALMNSFNNSNVHSANRNKTRVAK